LIAALGLFGAAAFGLAAFGLHYRAAASETSAENTFERLPPRERAADVRTTHIGPGGSARLDLEIEVVPDAVLRDKSGKEMLEYHLELSAQFKGTSTFNFQVDFFDDLWQPAGSVHASRLVEASDGTPAVTESFTTPPNLPDGFYQAEIKAVAVGPTWAGMNTAHIYLQVVEGRVIELSTNDWHKQSRTHFAVPKGTIAFPTRK
jgi:hypothetical protein